MSLCNHENIVKCHAGYFYMDRYWLILEFMDAGCLTDLIDLNIHK